MSNPSLSKILTKNLQLFRRLCAAHGWDSVTSVEQTWGYRFSATKEVKTPSRRIAVLEIRIELIPSEKKADFVLASMYLQSEDSDVGDILMPSWYFLEYHGKQFQTINPKVRVDDKTCWHVGAPKDLDAFLEGYDRLAKRLGYVTLFE